MTTPTPHHFSGGGWTTYMQVNGWLSCEVVASVRRINYSKITPIVVVNYAAIAVSSFSSITTWTFLSRTTTSSWRTLPQMTCSSHERPLVGNSIPRISIVWPQGCCTILQVMIHRWNPLIMYFCTVCFISTKIHSFRNKQPMYIENQYHCLTSGTA